MQLKPDCCKTPELEQIRTIYPPPGFVRELMRCSKCGEAWYRDSETRMGFDNQEDRDIVVFRRTTLVLDEE